MRFECKHHGKCRARRCSGKNNLQRVNDLACDARVLFYKRKCGNIVLTSFCEAHSHPVTEAMYRRDTDKIEEPDKELVKTLKNAGCKPAQIRRRLREEQDTRVTVAAVRRAIKLMDGGTDKVKEFNQFLDAELEKGSTINYALFPDGKLRYLTISTRKMKEAYRSTDPAAVQADTTFNFESSGIVNGQAKYLGLSASL